MGQHTSMHMSIHTCPYTCLFTCLCTIARWMLNAPRMETAIISTKDLSKRFVHAATPASTCAYTGLCTCIHRSIHMSDRTSMHVYEHIYISRHNRSGPDTCTHACPDPCPCSMLLHTAVHFHPYAIGLIVNALRPCTWMHSGTSWYTLQHP